MWLYLVKMVAPTRRVLFSDEGSPVSFELNNEDELEVVFQVMMRQDIPIHDRLEFVEFFTESSLDPVYGPIQRQALAVGGVLNFVNAVVQIITSEQIEGVFSYLVNTN